MVPSQTCFLMLWRNDRILRDAGSGIINCTPLKMINWAVLHDSQFTKA
jgi:hypothetical protein